MKNGKIVNCLRKTFQIRLFLCSMVLLTGHTVIHAMQGDGGAKNDPVCYGR